MKSLKYTLAALALGATVVSTTSCREDFTDINKNPNQIVTADASMLFTKGIIDFEPSGYLMWYYNAPMMQLWSQLGTPTGGYTPNFAKTTAYGDQGSQYIKVLKYVREMNAVIENAGEDGAKYKGYAAALDVLTAYLGILDTDLIGSVPFTEACMANYGGTLTPAYDSQESLYQLWEQQLNAAISVFSNPTGLEMVSAQDLAYNGDWTKWAKFANTVKLRLAARYVNINKSKALSLAQEVASASCGYIDSMDQAMLFNKATATSDNNQDIIYHWSNGFLDGQAASINVMNFMVKNLFFNIPARRKFLKSIQTV